MMRKRRMQGGAGNKELVVRCNAEMERLIKGGGRYGVVNIAKVTQVRPR